MNLELDALGFDIYIFPLDLFSMKQKIICRVVAHQIIQWKIWHLIKIEHALTGGYVRVMNV